MLWQSRAKFIDSLQCKQGRLCERTEIWLARNAVHTMKINAEMNQLENLPFELGNIWAEIDF